MDGPHNRRKRRQFDRGGVESTISGVNRSFDRLKRRAALDALLVARNGKLVLEEYFRGQDRDTQHGLRVGGTFDASLR